MWHQPRTRTGLGTVVGLSFTKLSILLIPVSVSAQEIVPLVNGTPADAEVVNKNFESLSTSVREVESRIDATDVTQVCGEDQFLDSDGDCNRVSRSGICEAGRLCTGGHEHVLDDLSEGDLDIGDGDYTDDERFGFFAVPGSAFTPDSHQYEYQASASGYVSPSSPSTPLFGTSFYGSAPIDLPDGSVITDLYLYWYDNVPNDQSQIWSCGIYRRQRLSADSEVVIDETFNGGSAGTPVVIQASESLTGEDRHVVDKSDYIYWFRAFVVNTDGTDNYRFYGCRVRYGYSNTNR